jgi:hypothetical protein
MSHKLLFAGVLMALLTACGASKTPPNPNTVAARRAQQAAQVGSVTTVEPLPTDEPTPAPVDALAVPWQTDQAPSEVAEYDGFINQALPYGALAALQFVALAISTLNHPAPRRAGLIIAAFGLISASALLAMFSGYRFIDLLGFVLVFIMGAIALAVLFGRVPMARSVSNG